MQMTVRKQIGKTVYSFLCEGKNLFDCVIEAEKLSFGDVLQCGLCKSDNLVLNAYETKEDQYKYVKVKCLSCKGDLTFGQQKKSPDTFYFRKTEDGKYDWKKQEVK